MCLARNSVSDETTLDERTPLNSSFAYSGCSVQSVDRKSRAMQRCGECVNKFSTQLTDLTEECKRLDCKKRLRQTCSLKTLKQRVPIIKWLPKYGLHHFQGDLIAGITVGLTVIPQSLAYAKIAELPPQYGLYSSFIGCFIYVLLGTSKDVNFGPTAVMSLLTAEFGHSLNMDDATYAIALALICGIIQIIMGVLHLGFLVEYISHPIINSFTTAAAITIASSQVKKWFGLKGVPRGFRNEVYYTLAKITGINWPDFGMGLTCMLILYLLKKIKDIKIKGGESSVWRTVLLKTIWVVSTARNAIIVVIASLLAAILFSYDITPFYLTGNIVSGIPSVKPPSFIVEYENRTSTVLDAFSTMGVGIIVVPVVGVIEVIAIGKAFGRKYGYDIDANQEFIASGAANLFGSFFSAYPVTASFSRSAVNAQSGSMTTAGGIFTGILVLLALAFLTPLFYYIPDAALAAVIIMAVVDMINFSMVKHLWTISKLDLLPWFTTFIVSLSAGFEYGIILGVVVSLMILLYPWARPQIKISPYEIKENVTSEQLIKKFDGILVIDVSMGLMFPGVEYLHDKIMDKALKHDTVNNAIVDFTRVHKLDYTSAIAIKELVDDFARHKAWIVFVNVQPDVHAVLTRAKVDIKHTTTVLEAAHMIASYSPPDDSLTVHMVPPTGIDEVSASKPAPADTATATHGSLPAIYGAVDSGSQCKSALIADWDNAASTSRSRSEGNLPIVTVRK